ncbi:MAG: methyl-accepting chemotaxis protein [Pseudomonadales bacterium]
MTLKLKLNLSYLLIALLPLLVLGGLSYHFAYKALFAQADQQLTAIREIKKTQVQAYFAERAGDLSILTDLVAARLEGSDMSRSALENEALWQKFVATYGYYDLFLINEAGDIFYTAAKEADYRTNLKTGPYRDSNLGTLFRQAGEQYQIIDFSPYAPSNNEPAAFIAQRQVLASGAAVVVALQLSIDKVNAIMQQRDGMGKTGESYLVGSDKRMRSDSYLDPEGHSIAASFAGTIASNGVDTRASQRALNGDSQVEVILDYNANPVLSAYTPVEIAGINWALIVEVDEAEILAPIHQIKWSIFCVFVAACVVVIALAFAIVRAITTPLGGEPAQMHDIADRIAQGHLNMDFSAHRSASGIYGAMQAMTAKLRKVLGSISGASGELTDMASRSHEVVSRAKHQADSQMRNLESVSSAMVEMSATIQEVAASASTVALSTHEVESLSSHSSQQVNHSREHIQVLMEDIHASTQIIEKVESNSLTIGSITEVIKGIADQTNLLALNAAIEAARAGDSGRGFAVVADEVRQLAQKTQTATLDINNMIDLLQQGTQSAVAAMERNSEKATVASQIVEQTSKAIVDSYTEIQQIAANASQIATAATQQAATAQEINISLVEISDSAQCSAKGMVEMVDTSEQLDVLSQRLQQQTLAFKL